MGHHIHIGPSISEVALMYGVTERTVRNWISNGLITAYKRNNHAVFIDERSLDNILTPIKGARR
jgi:DNA-binding transcriptional MerR regulator